VANLSRFDRIVVMPTIATPAVIAGGATPPVFAQPGNPTFQPPTQTLDDQDDERPAPNRGPMFNSFPPPQIANPNGGAMPPGAINPAQGPLMLPQPNVPTATPQPGTGQTGAYPAGVSVPGMIAPAPPQPGQPGQPGGPPAQPKRPGGGL
jgi:hypothetical protein